MESTKNFQVELIPKASICDPGVDPVVKLQVFSFPVVKRLVPLLVPVLSLPPKIQSLQ